ncbi:MAG: hypothetical protein RL542_1634, partial [Bacteroidota bacterium]
MAVELHNIEIKNQSSNSSYSFKKGCKS